jgi:hypothetical protein
LMEQLRSWNIQSGYWKKQAFISASLCDGSCGDGRRRLVLKSPKGSICISFFEMHRHQGSLEQPGWVQPGALWIRESVKIIQLLLSFWGWS